MSAVGEQRHHGQRLITIGGFTENFIIYHHCRIGTQYRMKGAVASGDQTRPRFLLGQSNHILFSRLTRLDVLITATRTTS